MADDERNVSGVWYGGWTSADPQVAPGRFIALLTDQSYTISGDISELASAGGRVLRSSVRGRRVEDAIDWIKQYDGELAAHAVRYSGAVNEDGTEIAGQWSFGDHSGFFVMARNKFIPADEEDWEVIKRLSPVIV